MKIPGYSLIGFVIVALSSSAIGAVTHYVDLNCPTPVAPYTDWSTAATNIQQAVDAAATDDLVLVTNGLYESGVSYLSGSNRLTINKSITVRSVNGPLATIIAGYPDPAVTNGPDSVRCVYLGGSAVLSGFTLTHGASTTLGGGVRGTSATIVSNCVIAGNSAIFGGGCYSCSLWNCVILQNVATNGAGCYNSSANNCLIVSNSAWSQGGGGYSGSFTNCTLAKNSASSAGGGIFAASGAWLDNSIVYLNTVESALNGVSSNWTGAKLDYCCTAPPPIGVSTGITNSPRFVNADAGDFHLSFNSPCINLGNNSYARGLDLDGKPRIVGFFVDIGAYEFPGVLHFVNLSNTAPLTPYASWARAATNIQDAVDAATNGDFVIVSNGVYRLGGKAAHGILTNRVTVTKPITLQSANGPAVTTIQGFYNVAGGDPIRCVYLTNGASLLGFTLTNGGTRGQGVPGGNYEWSGAGAFCEDASVTISNCVFINNTASFGGGGAFQGTIFNCLFTGNTGGYGGGGYSNTLNNCVLLKNYGFFDGGGAYGSTLNNCIVAGSIFSPSAVSRCTANNSIIYFNTNGANPNANYTNSTLNYCCTMPLPATGTHNFTNQPRFLNFPATDFHLLGTSPCVNAGQNALVANILDLDGNPRIRGDAVDVGAYEYQADASGQFFTWLQAHSLPQDGSADDADPDGDGLSNWQEWRAGTSPVDNTSLLLVLPPSVTTSHPTVTWQSETNVIYYLQRSTLPVGPFSAIQSNIVGQAGTTSFTDTHATGSGPFFYRVGVQ